MSCRPISWCAAFVVVVEASWRSRGPARTWERALRIRAGPPTTVVRAHARRCRLRVGHRLGHSGGMLGRVGGFCSDAGNAAPNGAAGFGTVVGPPTQVPGGVIGLARPAPTDAGLG